MDDQGAQDLQHLQLLSIFHYVVAGMAGLCALLPIFHLVIGLMFATQAVSGQDAEIGRAIGWMFVAFASLFILGGLTFAACLALAGRFLGQRTHYTFCLVMAGMACVFVPLGTVLGVFTLIVLVRPSVKALFEGVPAPAGRADSP